MPFRSVLASVLLGTFASPSLSAPPAAPRTLPVIKEATPRSCRHGEVRVFLNTTRRMDPGASEVALQVPRLSPDTLFANHSASVRLGLIRPSQRFVMGCFRFRDSLSARKASLHLPANEIIKDTDGYWGNTPFEVRIERTLEIAELTRIRRKLDSLGLRPHDASTAHEEYLSIGRCRKPKAARALSQLYSKAGIPTVISSFALEDSDL